MSRTIEQIEASTVANIQAEPLLATISGNTSRRAIWRLFAFAQSLAILILEQSIDVFKAENEIKIAKATPATGSWLAAQIDKFQYSATVPQVVQLIDLAPAYPVVDESLRIITRRSIVTTLANRVIIKLAKNEPPEALNNDELISAQAYVDTIGVPGIVYICSSNSPDRVYIDADIYYNGQYSTVIQGTVNNAINLFLANLEFNGQLKIIDLELAIRNITGVSDVLINNIKIRSSATPFADGTFLVQNKTTISRLFNTISGYVILEDAVPNNLNFIAV